MGAPAPLSLSLPSLSVSDGLFDFVNDVLPDLDGPPLQVRTCVSVRRSRCSVCVCSQ